MSTQILHIILMVLIFLAAKFLLALGIPEALVVTAACELILSYCGV